MPIWWNGLHEVLKKLFWRNLVEGSTPSMGTKFVIFYKNGITY